MRKGIATMKNMEISITKAASLQTYYTIRFLVDHEMVRDAYRAYAYFRWLDDTLDREMSRKSDRTAFVKRQGELIDDCYSGKPVRIVSEEEQMLVDLVGGDRERKSGLQSYIRHMMAVMIFDAERRDRLISQAELYAYEKHLAIAVTEALHYFIGHDCPSPHGEARYLAATAAHVTHMLRDTLEDVEAGYFNIPKEFLDANHIGPAEIKSEPYRSWIRTRVRLARDYFEAGKGYMARVGNTHCRLAGYAYIARFEGILDVIERDAFFLRSEYPEPKIAKAGAQVGLSLLWSAFNCRLNRPESHAVTVR
jgi:phytoene/squalene synthetase